MHPDDCSINTLYGPLVLQTLIRANFSPLDTTGGRFICSGSADGCVYIYDVLTGDVVDKLSGHAACVRDVAWHPSKPLIASASWDSFVKLWSFNSNVSERLGAKQWKKDRDAFSRFKIRDGEGSARGVENKERMLAIEEFRLMFAALAINELVPPDIAICVPRSFLTSALYN